MSHRVTRISGYGAISAHEPFRVYLRNASQVDVYDVHTSTLIESFTSLSVGAATDGSPWCGIEINPDNSFFLTQGTLGTGAYSTEDGSELYFLSNTNPSRPSISKDGAYIALAEGSGANTKIVETSGWTEDTSFDPSMGFREVYAWSHDGTKLAIGDNASNIKIFETSGWTAYSNTIAMSSDINDLAFSPDDTLLACAKRNTGSVDPISVMTVSSTMTDGSLFSDAMTVEDGTSLSFSRDGKILYVACNSSNDGDVEAFNIPAGTSYATITGADYSGGALDISVSSGGGMVVIGTSQNDAHVFNDKLELIATYSLSLTGSVGGVAFENPR